LIHNQVAQQQFTMDDNALSSPEYASRREEYKQRFYIPVLELSESTKKLLVEYSKIPEDQLQAHVERIVGPPLQSAVERSH